MRHAIVALGLFGALLFGGAFVYSLVNPLQVERAARELLRIEVERRVGARIDALSDARITAFGRAALAKAGRDVGRTCSTRIGCIRSCSPTTWAGVTPPTCRA